MLSCTPNPEFPGGKVIVWNIQDQAAMGEDFAGATGSFTTAESASGPFALSALLSRGELVEQVDTALLQASGQEFRALADKLRDHGLAFARPSQIANTLNSAGTVQATEFTDTDAQTVAFATNFPAGAYHFLINTTGSVSTATIGLSNGLLPTAPRLLNWQNPPHVILGQPLALEWTWDSGVGELEPAQRAQGMAFVDQIAFMVRGLCRRMPSGLRSGSSFSSLPCCGKRGFPIHGKGVLVGRVSWDGVPG